MSTGLWIVVSGKAVQDGWSSHVELNSWNKRQDTVASRWTYLYTWGTVYTLDISATNRLRHNLFREPPKWFNSSCENRMESYTLSNTQFSESSCYIRDFCTVSILSNTNVSSGVIRSTGSSRAKRCRLLHRNTRNSCKKTLLFLINNRNLCSHVTGRNLPLRISRFYSAKCAL
jgi:hypothetical protein